MDTGLQFMFNIPRWKKKKII